MDYQSFFKKVQNERVKYIQSKCKWINDEAGRLSVMYLSLIKDHITDYQGDIITSGKIVIPIGKCNTDCKEILDDIIEDKIKKELPTGMNLTKNINHMLNCHSNNPGFLGLYNLTSKSIQCKEYFTFDYIIDIEDQEDYKKYQGYKGYRYYDYEDYNDYNGYMNNHTKNDL